MGNSLGGTLSIYCGALLDDIDFVIAGSCVSSIDRSLLSIYHCSDLYIPKLREYFEFGDIMGLIAPKPLIVVQGREDRIFPIQGLNEAVSQAGAIYQACNAERKLRVLVGSGGHQFYSQLASKGLSEIRSPIR